MWVFDKNIWDLYIEEEVCVCERDASLDSWEKKEEFCIYMNYPYGKHDKTIYYIQYGGTHRYIYKYVYTVCGLCEWKSYKKCGVLVGFFKKYFPIRSEFSCSGNWCVKNMDIQRWLGLRFHIRLCVFKHIHDRHYGESEKERRERARENQSFVIWIRILDWV